MTKEGITQNQKKKLTNISHIFTFFGKKKNFSLKQKNLIITLHFLTKFCFFKTDTSIVLASRNLTIQMKNSSQEGISSKFPTAPQNVVFLQLFVIHSSHDFSILNKSWFVPWLSKENQAEAMSGKITYS